VSTTPQRTLSNAEELRAALLIYGASFGYMIALGMVLILVPLYALALDYDLGTVGIIVASQAVFGLALRLFAGAIADRFGERWILWASFGTIASGAVVFAISGAFWAMIAAQFLLGVSRTMYWTATQSYSSRINQTRAGVHLGRSNSAGNAGQMVGLFLGGVLAGTAGYGTAFTVMAGVAAVGLAGSLVLPPLPRKLVVRGFKQSLAPVPGLARSKGMGMAGFAAFAASTSIAFTAILIVPYLKELDFDESLIGTTQTFMAIGSVLMGVMFGRVLSRLGQQRIYLIAYIAQGLTLIGIAASGDALWLIAIAMFAYGVFHGAMGIVYTVTASTHSDPEQRGMAMAYVGLYWGVAHTVMPVAFGVIAATWSLNTSLWIGGAIFIAAGLTIPVVFPFLTHGRELPVEAATERA